MQIGMIGLGKMGTGMVRRLLTAGHDCVVHDRHPEQIDALVVHGAAGAATLESLVAQLVAPRILWLMVPAGGVDAVIRDLLPLLEIGDTIIDGGNSHYRDDIRRSAGLQLHGVDHIDVGTSGGIAGLERGFCLMVGGEAQCFERLRPIFRALAPGVAAAPRTPGRQGGVGTVEEGFLHCGPHGAGHFVKMVHNGIEYGLMAAYGEGLNILRNANMGRESEASDAAIPAVRRPDLYRYDLDLVEITEVWRRGSVVGSWLLDLAAAALLQDPDLDTCSERVSDSGEGRWTIEAAIDEGVPVPVLSAALFDRFASRGHAEFSHRILSAMRHGFGGHVEVPTA